MDSSKSTVSREQGDWLASGDCTAVSALLAGLSWLESGESVLSAEPAGAGNMNLTLRVMTERRSLILKQARPWVEKYPQILAPVERALVEAAFYRCVCGIDGAGGMMPALLGADPDSYTLLLEDLGDGSDLSSLYAADAGTIDDGALVSLAGYLGALHAATRDRYSAPFANRCMRALNHEHIFVVPFVSDNGLALDDFEPGLAQAAIAIQQDKGLVEQVDNLGQRYLADGASLLHGDFFLGSWLVTSDPRALWVIDPEFCFFGDPEFDFAVALAHLVLARQPLEIFQRWIGLAHSSSAAELDNQLIARYAGTEVLRRVLGVAQLPIRQSDGWRADVVLKAAGALRTGGVEELF